MYWLELTQGQKYVVALAVEESDLSALLISWNRYHGKPTTDENIDQLRSAILVLADARLLEVFPSEDPGAWHEPRNDVIWLVLSDHGNALLAGANPTELATIYAG
jgi:hypothetical protein